jgi:hypothetical protein
MKHQVLVHNPDHKLDLDPHLDRNLQPLVDSRFRKKYHQFQKFVKGLVNLKYLKVSVKRE